ncbi:MAG: Dolichyl-phosphate beta-D-mannosyltransferase [Microgenomates group bacterium GW2011_GWA2_46_7]|nr:MAG: Dolichyl-phosphate beta-D-mannosyltransferase [Microgenomates group bacterium GW2011_GWC2_46_7]KKU46738.1 MAG: Dolichyl-phosphate beta-D-mannosyltransferase [Microgenomates group bacterium GW2011_GWA2_46_7]
MHKVVVVIPTYNEAGNIARVTSALAKVFATISNYDLHILFVDDNSPDGTRVKIAEVIHKYPYVHILNNKRKGGLGHAYKKGFAYAIDKLGADILFEFDADLSHDPTIIPAMLEDINSGASLVLGSRYIQGGGIPKNWAFHRKFLSVVGNLFIQVVMLNFKVHDWTTGYRALTKEAVLAIMPQLQGKVFAGYSWQTGFLVRALELGLVVKEVPLVFIDRENGKSKLGPEYLFNNFVYIMRVRMKQIFSSRIFKFVMVGGFGSLVQFTSLYLYRMFIPSFQLANFLSIETAILSNFALSNLWTFADRKLKASAIPGKFLQFNLASFGSIVIQLIVAFLGERFIGLHPLFAVPVINLPVDTGVMFAVTGIALGMFWNFFAYSHFVWKKK